MDEGGNIIIMRKICRPGGYITVEASFVFPIIFFIIFGLLKFGFGIYNNVVDNSLKVYMGLRVREIEKNYFNPVAQEIDLKRIANEGLIQIEDIRSELSKKYLQERVSEYRNSIVIGDNNKVLDADGDRGLKNSTVVRFIHLTRVHAGRIKKDD